MNRPVPPPDGDDPEALDRLIRESRAARDAMLALVTRVRQERVLWEQEARALATRPRLTEDQREIFRDRLRRRGRDD